ncbi:ubiquitin carboxyl-terminal hydrolase 8-like isoform X2 [Camellia sinensis]|uniref:ubiquitin carboxyl-terminal hydrolase 8-like isoform X2 n=1 Tax=Camellia sinensis TaxID=4442 RepID=UPI00103661C2|nr:ubiquitin carboxyl-terminal hydrolase 8-like isoform X2 [Camellia sinensis]
MSSRPPDQTSPSSSSSSSSPTTTTRRTRLRKLSDTIRFSLRKPTTTTTYIYFLSLLNRFLSKTLDFLSMDSLLFPPDDDDTNDLFLDRSLLTPHPSSSSSSLPIEQLYFVPYRWWSEARESLFGDSGEVKGVLYAAEWSGPRLGTMGIWVYDSKIEISLNLRREDCSRKSDCGEQGDYALIAEWMFLRALKWHSDGMEVGGFIAAEDHMQDLFPLRIRLSVSWETDLLVVKISQKDNKISAFSRACDIFCVESGLLSIWDFSGQTTQIFTHDRIKLSDVSDQPDEEIHLELQVYGSSFFMKMGGGRQDEMTVEQSIVGGSLRGGSLQMNGNTDHVNSYIRVNRSSPFGSSYKEACNLGLTGLYNLGNTCFMNSAIQCLVHTPKLVDYFLGDYRKDINTENPLGMNGELALLFGDLLRKLWAPGATPVAPRAFKSKLSAFAPQFSGYNQHDSQEFLAFLLDGLHEDLNRVKYKPYIEAKEAEDRLDEEVADEHWRNHLARNDSIIVDVCQGQYRSKLVCPACKKLSVTFDPFMYLSLPLPSTTMRSMTLTVMSTDGSTLPFPVTVTVPKYGRCKDLVQALSTTCSLRDDEKLLVAEIFNNRILHFLDNSSDTIELIRDNDLLVAYRLPKDSETSSLVVFMHEQVERHFLNATSSSKMFGIPLVARISDLSRGSEIRREFLKLLNSFLMPVEDSLNEVDNDQNSANEDIDMEDVISSRLSDRDVNSDSGSGDDSHLGPDDFQFYLMEERGGLLSKVQKMQMNEIVTISELTRPINVLVSWPDKMTKLYDTCLLSSLPQICKPGLLTKEPKESVSLYKCLEAFLKEEPLGPEDMWYCPNCKKHRQASKKLDLWRLPEILIIHLKRFSYNRFFKNKLETFVDFPIDDFDLSTYIVHQSAQVSHRYVLYAVSNHYGGMGGGHYTAFVQLGRDRWYEFDDSLVSPASKEQIKTSAAYVLFYRRIPDV